MVYPRSSARPRARRPAATPGYVSAPVPALYDWRSTPRSRPRRQRRFQLHERRRVADRDCQVYRTGSAVEALRHRPHRHGLCRRVHRRLRAGARRGRLPIRAPARHLLATTVTEQAGGDIAASPEPADTTTTLTEIDAATRADRRLLGALHRARGLRADRALRVQRARSGRDGDTDRSTDPTATTTVAPMSRTDRQLLRRVLVRPGLPDRQPGARPRRNSRPGARAWRPRSTRSVPSRRARVPTAARSWPIRPPRPTGSAVQAASTSPSCARSPPRSPRSPPEAGLAAAIVPPMATLAERLGHPASTRPGHHLLR